MHLPQRPLAELPHFEWTASIHPRFADLSVSELAVSAITRADQKLSQFIHPQHRAILTQARTTDLQKNHEIRHIIDEVADGGIRFVQIGAHDGLFDDPFAQLIQLHGWNALLVEPQADAFKTLAATYADNPNVSVANVAIDDAFGTLTLYKALFSGRYRANGTAIASANKAQVRAESRRNIGLVRGSFAHIVAEQVCTVTLPQLLHQYGKSPESIDFFACDTEGSDTRIVDQLLNTGAKPEFLQYEHLNAPKSDVESVDRRLRLGKYTLIKTHKDTFAYR